MPKLSLLMTFKLVIFHISFDAYWCLIFELIKELEFGQHSRKVQSKKAHQEITVFESRVNKTYFLSVRVCIAMYLFQINGNHFANVDFIERSLKIV